MSMKVIDSAPKISDVGYMQMHLRMFCKVTWVRYFSNLRVTEEEKWVFAAL